ncbi:hypothetical protein THAR02_06760 [Trichoderma harzianum]|uniref:Uncharacterized protein n=1 Tax=Trichoderma harzianum TaxID=5544 RepID=A0A0F9X7G7_TRIHA|nr:hypothetical protein THAR02_06760 [Trichoderma harzianum]
MWKRSARTAPLPVPFAAVSALAPKWLPIIQSGERGLGPLARLFTGAGRSSPGWRIGGVEWNPLEGHSCPFWPSHLTGRPRPITPDLMETSWSPHGDLMAHSHSLAGPPESTTPVPGSSGGLTGLGGMLSRFTFSANQKPHKLASLGS